MLNANTQALSPAPPFRLEGRNSNPKALLGSAVTVASTVARFRRLCCHEPPLLVSVVDIAMSGADGAADSHNLDEVAGSEHDQTSDCDSVGSNRKGGRPVDAAWGSFKRVASNRAWIGVCNDYMGIGFVGQGPGSTAFALTQVLMFEQKNLYFRGQADQVQMPDMDFGTTELGEWSVDELL